MSKDVYMLTLKCTNMDCFVRLRIGRILSQSGLQIGALKFCPVCGKRAFAATDNDNDYWESLAKHYGMTVEMIKMIHSVWEPQSDKKFSEHVAEMLKEAGLEVAV